MPNQILKEMLHAYSNIPLGLLIFKEKKLFFLNKYMRNIVVLGDLDTENSVKVICSTLNLEPNQEALLNFLSNNEFFCYKEKYIQISSNSVDNLDIFVFTRVSELLLENLNVTQEIPFVPIATDDMIAHPVDSKEHLKLLKYFGKKLNSTITTHAIFKGVPLISDNKILQVYKNTLVIRIEDKQLITAFKESPWILKISQDINIKGTVVHLEKEKRYLFLKDLHRVIHNYNLRKAIRYKPEEAVDVIMTIDSKTITMPLIDISEHAFKVTTDNQVIVDKIITHPTTIQTQIILDGKKIQLKSHSMIEPRIVNAKADIIMGYSSNEMNLTLLKDWRNARQLEIIKEVHNFKKNLI